MSLPLSHSGNMDQRQRIEYPKLDQKAPDQSKGPSASRPKQSDDAFITEEVMQSLFRLLTLIDTVYTDRSYHIFHLFVETLPFVQYSNDNIDRNARFFGPLFKLDFDALRSEFEAKREAAKRAQNEDQHKVLKAGYGPSSETLSDSKSNDSDDDDEDGNDDN